MVMGKKGRKTKDLNRSNQYPFTQSLWPGTTDRPVCALANFIVVLTRIVRAGQTLLFGIYTW